MTEKPTKSALNTMLNLKQSVIDNNNKDDYFDVEGHEKQVANGLKYFTIHNYKIKIDELKLADLSELKAMTEIFYNTQLEPKNFSKTIILDKNDFPGGIDAFRQWVISKIKLKQLFTKK